MSSDRALMCPSVPPHYPDAVAFGVVTGSADAPDMVPLIPPLPVQRATALWKPKAGNAACCITAHCTLPKNAKSPQAPRSKRFAR